MALQFIAGPSGCGKSHYAYKRIIDESLLDPEGRFYVIVPEQFTMETQRALAAMHPAHSLINIDILSFNRLAYRVFEACGQERTAMLGDTGKILVLQKILNENKDSLKVLKGLLWKSGAAASLNSLLSELTQYRADLETVDSSGGSIPGLLQAKLDDIALIRRRFFEYTQKKYLIMEEVPEVLSRHIEAYEPLRGAAVVFDGFTGFVPTQLLVIERLLKICKSVTVTVTVDKAAGLLKSSGALNLFHMSHEMTRSLVQLAHGAGTEVLPEIWADAEGCGRHKRGGALAFLEANLFRYTKRKFSARQEEIYIGSAASCAQEAESAAEIISKLVREKGYRYRDFAFVTGDIEAYGPLAETVFSQNRIPCFLDARRSVNTNPAVTFVRAAAEMAASDLSYKSVFAWLKTGLTDLTKVETSLLENYVLAAGVRSLSGYKKTWERTFKTIDSEALAEANRIREKFLTAVLPFAEGFKIRNGSVKERTLALYKLIADNSLQEKCRGFEDAFRNEGLYSRASEYSQVYRAIITVLEKLVEILGDERVSLEMYRKLLDAAFEDTRLGITPLASDEVLIGDIERSRLSGVKVMFFAGLNDGIVPKVQDDAGLLSESERSVLSENGVSLAPAARERMYRQRLYLYLNLTKPSERLYLSYSRIGSDGSASKPSYLVKSVCDMFPGIEISDLNVRDSALRMQTRLGREGILTEGYARLSQMPPEGAFAELVSYCMRGAEGRNKTAMFSAAVLEKKPDTNISKKTAGVIYGVERSYSASRLELAASCAFSHFLSYGLRLDKRDIYEFTPADVGTILHEAARLFCEEMKNRSWEDLTDADRDMTADGAFMRAYENSVATEVSESAAFDRLRLGYLMRRTAWALVEQVKRGGLYPAAFEREFVTDGVRGTIDRIDVGQLGDVKYVRVIDYKSGKKDFSMTDFYLGTQLQLPLYMSAAIRLEEYKSKGMPAEAAGMYYYAMSDPLIDVTSLDDEITPEAALKEFKLKGITRSEPEILRLADGSLSPGVDSKIVPVHVTKKAAEDGGYSFSTHSRAMSGEDFYNIGKYTDRLIKTAKARITGGAAEIDPKRTPQSDSCAYCEYRGICRFDERIPGYKKPVYGKEEDADVLRRIVGDLYGREALDGDQLV